MIDLKILVSNSYDPYFNQSVESHIFYNTEDYVLMLYVNEPCVVIGRNQNPWKEVNMEGLSVPLIRRLSGGGTVYHDKGNLNFSFIYNEGDTTVEKNFDYVMDRLKMLGIDLSLTPRNDLFYRDAKVSGNAFYRRGNRRLHHGTLLIDVDTSALWQHLKFDHSKFKCKSVPSHKSPIINLKAVIPHLTPREVMTALAYDHDHYLMKKDVKSLDFDQYKSKTWLLEETPKFKYEYNGLSIEIIDGRIKSDIISIDDKLFSETLIKKEVEHVSRVI